MPQELSKSPWRTELRGTCLSRGEIFSCLEPTDTEEIAELFAVRTKGNYRYTTKVPRPDSDENASEIESDGEDELNRRVGHLPQSKKEYIYKLRVEQGDRNRRIYIEAQVKDVSTPI